MTLSKRVGASLSRLEDDAVAIQCFHAHSLNLLPAFNGRAIERALRGEHCDGDHWLLLYEGVRKGYLVSLNATVRANTFMSQLLSSKVSFYRTEMPAYAMLLHPGGAPEWVVSAWLKGIAGPTVTPPTPTLLAADLTEVATTDKTVMDVVRELLHKFSKRSPAPAELYE